MALVTLGLESNDSNDSLVMVVTLVTVNDTSDSNMFYLEVMDYIGTLFKNRSVFLYNNRGWIPILVIRGPRSLGVPHPYLTVITV